MGPVYPNSFTQTSWITGRPGCGPPEPGRTHETLEALARIKRGDRLRKEVPQVQLTTVGKAIWRGASKAQELEAAGAGDPQVQERLEKLKQVETLRRRGVPWREVQEVVGISRATYYRWRKRLKEEGLSGLRPRSRRPKRTRGKVRWSPEILLAIEGLRKGNPTWGR
jgi:predicted DNA-binding transcriptional regulator AlpA